MTKTAPLIDIREDHWDIVQGILQKHVPQYEVWAFGSRTKWTAKQYSDLDLAIITDKPISLDVSASLSDDFSESDLPYNVDIVDWATTSESFRKIIEQDKVVVQRENAGLGMAKAWRFVPLIDLAATPPTYGVVQPGQNSPHGVPMVRVNNFQDHSLNLSDVMRIAPEVESKYSRTRIQEGDVLITIVGSTGQVAIASSDLNNWNIAHAVAMIRPKKPELSRWIALVLRSPDAQNQLRIAANTTVQTTINLKDLRQLQVPLPDECERNAIAHILGTLDDKIELNRKQNETLEAMARALFKAWFVDFEPVRAKMEGRWQRGQSLPGLPAHLYDLFPDRLVDSELGEIPEGWELTSVDVEFDVTMGQSPPGHTYNETGDGLPFYQGRADFEFRFPKRRVYCTAPTRLAKNGDTLVSVRAPVGDINMASEACAIGRGVAAVRHKTGCRSYTHQFMSSMSDVFARFNAEGTVFGSIGKKDFHSIAHVRPPRDLVLAYEKLAAQPDDQIERNERESRSLAQLRDTLLPKLISGELRVSEVESFIKERGL